MQFVIVYHLMSHTNLMTVLAQGLKLWALEHGAESDMATAAGAEGRRPLLHPVPFPFFCIFSFPLL